MPAYRVEGDYEMATRDWPICVHKVESNHHFILFLTIGQAMHKLTYGQFD